jgi:hypothetical protein
MLIAVPLMRTLSGTPWLWKEKNILSPKQEGTNTGSKNKSVKGKSA